MNKKRRVSTIGKQSYFLNSKRFTVDNTGPRNSATPLRKTRTSKIINEDETTKYLGSDLKRKQTKKS